MAHARWVKIMTKIRNSPFNPLVELAEEKIEQLKSKVLYRCGKGVVSRSVIFWTWIIYQNIRFSDFGKDLSDTGTMMQFWNTLKYHASDKKI